MVRPSPRVHRLPQRLDWALVPAPLDLSLPLASEKSPLPAIIVTPSSPSSTGDFAIAFLAPPPKPNMRERITSYTSPIQTKFQTKFQSKFSFSFSARTTIVLLVLMLIMMCHVVAHRLAINRPHFNFSKQGGVEALATDGSSTDPSSWISWFDFRVLLASDTIDVKRDFTIIENATS